jgi:GNAT superfamily N-acetyltransferase
VRIRPAREEDLIDLGRVFATSAADLIRRYRPEQVGRYSVEPESRLLIYRHLLGTGRMFVADDGRPVGFSAAIVRDGVWFLSQLWVLPDRQGEGIGRELLDEALVWGRGATAFTVVASPHPGAMTLYLRASMHPLWVECELTGEAGPEGSSAETTILTKDDTSWVDALDREVRGAARPEDHSLFRAQATGLALRRDGEPRGYVYVWGDGKVGPGAVQDPVDTGDLLVAARRAASGPITVAVPSTNWTALRELVAAGLRPIGTNTFMSSRPLGDGSRYLSSGGALG